MKREVSKRKKAYKAPRRRLEPFYGFGGRVNEGEIRVGGVGEGGKEGAQLTRPGSPDY